MHSTSTLPPPGPCALALALCHESADRLAESDRRITATPRLPTSLLREEVAVARLPRGCWGAISTGPSECRRHRSPTVKEIHMALSIDQFWAGGARLAVAVSMQFEAGGQPISGAPGPVTEPVADGYPDRPQNSFYDSGVREGILRLLDLFDKHDIKVTSFMIGEAVDKHPEVANEIVGRGHEAAAHGRRWANQYLLEPEEERAWIADSVTSIEAATGTRARGYNNYWIRGSGHTLELLQQLDFTYRIDDLSADEPFIQELPGPFVTVPYTVHMNDLASFDFAGLSPDDYDNSSPMSSTSSTTKAQAGAE